jgi:hypothetical protein
MHLHKSLKINGLNSTGQSAVEFAFIIPVLFIFFYAVLEFSRLFILDQRVAILSREAANACFQDCTSLTGANLDNCLGGIVNQIKNNADSVLTDFSGQGTVIASVYTNQKSPPAVLFNSQKAGGGSYTSQIESPDAQLVSDQGSLVIGEVFYPYSPLTPIKKLLGALNLPEKLYEKTIY